MTGDQGRGSSPLSKKKKLDEALDSPPNVLSETDVGISEFMHTKNAGFQGTMKGRWEDFLVREVDLTGKICRLSSLVPKDTSNGTSSAGDPSSSYIIPIEIDEILKEIDRETMFEASFPASDDKNEREMFHKAIRLNYPSLVSKTIEMDNNRYILVTRGSLVKGKKAWERASKSHDPPKQTPFCHFVLYKEGKDTMQALHIVGRLLKINSKSFNYAGTKDRRAVTTQNVSIKNISARRLSTLNPRLNGIKLGNFSYSADSIKLGELYGNRFSIVIRQDSVLHKAIQDWQKHGFINYFGLQRFGHCAEARTYDIGREIIRCNWEKAIDLILTPTSSDLPIVRQIKERYLRTRDAKACGDDMAQCLEKTLLLGIARHGKTIAALQTLPRNLRQLYAHSYQSLVWNKVASRRIRELGVDQGDRALVGDLYFADCPSISKGLRSVDSSSEMCYDESFDQSTVAVPVAEATSAACDVEGMGAGDMGFEVSKAAPVTPAAPSRVTECGERPLIYQVVLPLPGYDVVFPDNESGKWYTEILHEDSLKIDDFNHKVKDFALPGSYRHLVVKPEDVHYEIREYTDSQKPLVQSDYARMTANEPAFTEDEALSPSKKEEKCRALVLEFTLPKAAYATMAIRELMKDVTVVQ
ncbi:Multisubstrate pseudouridine synthase 7 [Taenia solium]|eukprot:TsM_000194400 transcript=TsM_000194400 gene=TsM_000194400